MRHAQLKNNMENNQSVQLKTEHGEDFEIPEGGSLGLLAFGYLGLVLWREKRNQLRMKNEELRMKNER
jgi:hypothetical protein